MRITPIRTKEAYEAGVQKAAKLAGKMDQASLDDLDVLSAVLEHWERAKIDLPPPEPLGAIRFRMEQAGLKPRDLEPFIGSRARVSEVLSGSRALTLDMMRALHRHLGVPASSLLGAADAGTIAKVALPSNAALKKLSSLGAIKTGEDYPAFLARAFRTPQTALLRKSRTERTNAKTDQAALTAWCGAVMLRADSVALTRSSSKPAREIEAPEAARYIARLSVFPDGPIRARDALAQIGIVLIVLEHLPGTYLDGAAMLRSDSAPVIAMTLRHDRLDNFWFTLLHELCHAFQHLTQETTLILDDLELKSSDNIEAEADIFAQEALIPSTIWSRHVSPEMQGDKVLEIAAAAEIHPAVVAGRWQREHGDYRRFSKMLGRGEVRSQFGWRSKG